MSTIKTPKIGQSAITGYVGGVYNKDSKSFKIIRGKSSNGKRYQIFEIGVANKDKDGNWTNGQSIKVMMFGDKKVEERDQIGLLGQFKPDNWTNKEGKTIYGNVFMADADDMFEPATWGGQDNDAELADEDEDMSDTW